MENIIVQHFGAFSYGDGGFLFSDGVEWHVFDYFFVSRDFHFFGACHSGGGGSAPKKIKIAGDEQMNELRKRAIRHHPKITNLRRHKKTHTKSPRGRYAN